MMMDMYSRINFPGHNIERDDCDINDENYDDEDDNDDDDDKNENYDGYVL